MKLTSLGDLAQSFGLRRQTVALKLDIQRLSGEVTTGRAANLAEKLGGDFGPLAGIDTSMGRLRAYQSAGATAGLFAAAMQTALSAVEKTASDYGAALLTAGSSTQPAQLAAVLADGVTRFEATVGLYNTRLGDRTLFAGQDTQGTALVDADTMLSALETAITGLVGANETEAAISAWFDQPTGFAAQAYKGGAALLSQGIAPGETAHIDVTAKDPAIRATLKGLAMAALLDRGALSDQPQAKADLARRAGLSLIASQTDRAALAARLGTAEGAIEAAQVRNEAELSALGIARSGLVSVDPYQAATEFEAAQSQLETIYSITARMTRLSLVDFLR